MNERRFSLEPYLDDEPVRKSGLRVRTLSLSSGTIGSDRELQEVIALGDPDSTITAIRRSDLDPEYLRFIAEDAETNGQGRKTMYTHWNQTGGMSPINAMPHLHHGINVHVAPDPSELPTAFFSTDAVRDAVINASLRTKHPINIRRQLQNALRYEQRKRNKYSNALYHGLVTINDSREGQLPLLECIQEIQREAHEMSGMIEVPLSTSENGMVIIPRWSAHARSLLQELFRTDSQTAWRYFKTRSINT